MASLAGTRKSIYHVPFPTSCRQPPNFSYPKANARLYTNVWEGQTVPIEDSQCARQDYFQTHHRTSAETREENGSSWVERTAAFARYGGGVGNFAGTDADSAESPPPSLARQKNSSNTVFVTQAELLPNSCVQPRERLEFNPEKRLSANTISTHLQYPSLSKTWTLHVSATLIEEAAETPQYPSPSDSQSRPPPHADPQPSRSSSERSQQSQNEKKRIHRKPVHSVPSPAPTPPYQSPVDYFSKTTPPPPYSYPPAPQQQQQQHDVSPTTSLRISRNGPTQQAPGNVINRKSLSPPLQPEEAAPRPPVAPAATATPIISLPHTNVIQLQRDAEMTNKLQHKRATSAPRAPPQDHFAPPPPMQHRPPPPMAFPVDTKNPGRLHKQPDISQNMQPLPRRRSSSVGGTLSPDSHGPLGQRPAPRQGRLVAPDPPRGRSSSAQPPANRDSFVAGARIPSNPAPGGFPRPGSAHNANASPGGSQSPPRKAERLRRSWLPGGRSRSNSQDLGHGQSHAWIMTPDNSGAEYNTSLLVNAEKVPELWNENANVFVFLYPRESGCGPSFKVQDSVIKSSALFNRIIQAENAPRGRISAYGNRDSLSVEDATRPRQFSPPTSPPTSGPDTPGEVRLYIPHPPPSASGNQQGAPGPSNLDRLVVVRNLFAFLTGQPLIATHASPTPFAAFMRIARLLEEFGYSSFDGSSFGPEVDLSFGFFLRQVALGDVRHSREKTIESLVLSERMRSRELYNEAFTHAVGKYSALVDIKSPLFEKISHITRQRLDRAHLDLLTRQNSVNLRLEQFDIPSLFAGVASSTTMYREVRFKQWRNAFQRMRTFVLGHYKAKFGNWPPKASSKKNPFSESGLNRLVLKALYADMCALYDLIADRTCITPRVHDQPEGGNQKDAKEEQGKDSMIAALRKILYEFDNSSPPVLPPMPFDVPTIPTMATILATYDSLPQKDQQRFDKKIKDHELTLILEKSYDFHTHTTYAVNPFLAEFKDFERREARGKTSTELADNRIGFWLFLYVVIQSLPMLVIDAPGLLFTEEVEYFLCEPPMGSLPWAEDAQVRKMWYEISGGQQIVELNADAVMFSVEATYHRSHCWMSGKIWEQALELPGGIAQMQMQGPSAGPEQGFPPLEPPPGVYPDADGVHTAPSSHSGGAPSPPNASPPIRPRNQSPARRTANRSSIAFGIEPIAFPDSFNLPPPGIPGGPMDRSSRVMSAGPSHHARSSSLGPRPASAHTGRSISSSNLSAMSNATPTPRASFYSTTNMSGNGSGVFVDTPGSGNSGGTSSLTFDAILAGQEAKPKKKKSFFFA